MKTAIAYEWCRVRTLRSTWWLAATTLLASALLTWAFGTLLSHMTATSGTTVPGHEALVAMLIKSPLTPAVAGTLGVFAMGHEYQHGTIRTTLMVTPRRLTALCAKGLSIGCFSMLLALANLSVAWLVVFATTTVSLEDPAPATLLRVHVGQVLLVLGWGLAGVFLGALIRSQTTALFTLLSVPFIAEPILRALLRSSGQPLLEQASALLPFSAASALTDAPTTDTSVLAGTAQLSPLAGGLVFFTSIAVQGAAASTLLTKRGA
ncbi:ABC transporter permease subunit (plasmid) [Streptomyces murinus]|uniref:ABC transporter permease subunit n=1 Tax=Streptomyces murinus TaxID=33900 RepID=UPI000A1FBCEE|nr:ABC transporter permease subunit [Streptomyces murinus]WDO11360.1 ABC transporter permease subunit [Streptomyces murinus]